VKLAAIILSVGALCAWQASAQPAQFFNPVQLTNREVALTVSSFAGQFYRLDWTTNLTLDPTNRWSSLVSFQSTGANQHTDSAAPFSLARFYRAEQLTNAPLFTGDHLSTTNGGDIVIHPVNHASFVMSWNGKVIYNDPVGGSTLYTGLPKADLILVSHSHSDHFANTTLNAQRGANCVILAPIAVYNAMTTTLQALTRVLTNGISTNVYGITVETVTATNSNHLPGFGLGYVLNIGGRRVYMAGDTGDIPPIHALTNIDVAFLCMNIPFTMTAPQATNAVRAFRPAVVYPYHYQNSGGATTNAAYFKQILGLDSGTEVRLRKWY
jgi:L-ascorbate metabolism protein UlaG (beta-lactamase superfamily)